MSDNDQIQRLVRETERQHTLTSNNSNINYLYYIRTKSQKCTQAKEVELVKERQRDRQKKSVCVRIKKFRRLILITIIGHHSSLFIKALSLLFFRQSSLSIN